MTCGYGIGVCVSAKHNLVVVGAKLPGHLDVYSLADRSFVRSVTFRDFIDGRIGIKHKVDGGHPLSTSPTEDSVLVAQSRRLLEVDIMGIGSCPCIRYIGEGVLVNPLSAACNSDVISVIDNMTTLYVFSWKSGTLLNRVSGGLCVEPWHRFMQVLSNNQEFVTADLSEISLRVCRFDGTRTGAVFPRRQNVNMGWYPWDILELDGMLLVSTFDGRFLASFNPSGRKAMGSGYHDGPFRFPSNSRIAFARLSDGGVIARDCASDQLWLFPGLKLRFAWVCLCVCV